MDKRTPLPMTPFDTLTSSGELQMLKLLLPYTPPAAQRMLAFFIRFTELQNTIRYFGIFSRGPERKEFQSTPPSFTEMLEELKPYMGENEGAVDSILSAMSMMEMMKDMDLSGMGFPDMSGADPGGTGDILNMMNLFQGTPREDDVREDDGREDRCREGTEEGSDDNRKGVNDNGTGLDESPGDGTY